MRRKNPKYMKEIISFVDRFYPRHGRSPSCSEIAANTTLNRSVVHNYLVAMNDGGMIEYNGQTIMTPNTRANQQGMRRICIFGSVSCGLPTDATVEQDEYMNLPMTMMGYDDVYILYAKGDSMINPGIPDGNWSSVLNAASSSELVAGLVKMR